MSSVVRVTAVSTRADEQRGGRQSLFGNVNGPAGKGRDRRSRRQENRRKGDHAGKGEDDQPDPLGKETGC